MSDRRSNHVPVTVLRVQSTLPCLDNASFLEASLATALHLSFYHLDFRVFDAFLLTNHGRSVVSAIAKVLDASQQCPNPARS